MYSACADWMQAFLAHVRSRVLKYQCFLVCKQIWACMWSSLSEFVFSVDSRCSRCSSCFCLPQRPVPDPHASAPRCLFYSAPETRQLCDIEVAVGQNNWQHFCILPLLGPFICSPSVQTQRVCTHWELRRTRVLMFHHPLPPKQKITCLAVWCVTWWKPWGKACSFMRNCSFCVTTGSYYTAQCLLFCFVFLEKTGFIKCNVVYRERTGGYFSGTNHSLGAFLRISPLLFLWKKNWSVQPQTSALQWGIVCREPLFLRCG